MLSGFVKKLLFARQFFIIDGKIEVLGKKQILLPSDLIIELEKIDSKKVYDISKRHVQQNMEEYAKKIGTTSQGMLKSMQDIFEIFGIGKPEVIICDGKKKEAVIRFHNPPIKELCDNKTDPALLPGALAGMYSFIFKKDVNCTSTSTTAGVYEYKIK
jgi:predicted hydrocarbon binding protein